MSKELTKELMCVLVRPGIEIWIEKEKLDIIMKCLEKEGRRFVSINDNIINTADISGIFKASQVEDMRRRKNNQWQCKWGYWHQRGENCAHGELDKFK